MFKCHIYHRRSVAVLCVLYKIGCNQMHPLNDALPGPYVPVRVTSGVLVAHLYTSVSSRCRTTQYRRTFVPLSVSLWNYDLADPVFDGAGLAGFESKANAFYWPSCFFPTIYSLRLFFPFCSFLSIGWYCGAGVFGLVGCITLSLSILHCRPLLIIIIKL